MWGMVRDEEARSEVGGPGQKFRGRVRDGETGLEIEGHSQKLDCTKRCWVQSEIKLYIEK